MFRDRIQEKYDQLSPRFRVLADFILENTLDVGFVTATELARRVGVDPATVVRFSQEVGYSGYRELSREIKQYINNKLALRYKQGAPEAEGLAGEVAVLADELSDRILSFKADAEQIAEAARMLRGASQVFVVSKGEGYGIASLWSTYLNIIGIESRAVQSDVAQAALLLRDSEASDLLVLISLGLDPDAQSGHLLHVAQERGLQSLTLTTSPTLIPAREADLNLTVPAKTPSGYPSFDTLMALLSLLWQALIKTNEQQSRAGVEGTTETLRSLVEQQEEVPEYDVAAVLRLWEES